MTIKSVALSLKCNKMYSEGIKLNYCNIILIHMNMNIILITEICMEFYV